MNVPPSTPSARRFSLWLYLLIVFGVSWPLQVVSVAWADGIVSAFLLNGGSMVMVTVGTYVAGRYVFRDGFAHAGWRWGSWKGYTAALGLASVLWIVPTLLDWAAGNLNVPAHLNKARFGWLVALPVLTLVPAFGEEFGWRGYLLPRLAQRFTPRWAVLVHGVIWWAWHIPILAGTGIAVGPMVAHDAGLPPWAAQVLCAGVVVVVTAIPAILHAVVIAYLWARSGSLAVATVYHAAYDGFRDSLAILVGIGPIAGAFAILLLMTLGIFFLWKGTWQLAQADTAVPVIASVVLSEGS
jgi:uncharacterized protein